jgi:hypothetical protein
MFMAARFTIAKLWEQPGCPTTDKWIKKMWYFSQWNFIQPQGMNFSHLQVMGGTGDHHLK